MSTNKNKKPIRFVIAILCYGISVAGVFFFIGYKAAYGRMENFSGQIQQAGAIQPPDDAKLHDSAENKETAAFVKNVSADSIAVDIVEYIEDTDTERVKELKLTEADMPDGYYISNPDEKVTTWKCNADTVYTFIDWYGDFTGAEFPEEYTTMNIEEFQRYIETYDNGEPKMPFFFTVENGYVKQIVEKPFA